MSQHKATLKAADKHASGQDKQPDSNEQTFKAGDKVTWDSSQGTIHGTVEKKLTPMCQNRVRQNPMHELV